MWSQLFQLNTSAPAMTSWITPSTVPALVPSGWPSASVTEDMSRRAGSYESKT